MSDTGFRGLMARFFGGTRQDESETRESIKRAAGVTPTEQRPSGDELDHGEVQGERRDRSGG